MAHPVNWFQISGKDPGEGKALQSFYKKIFGWKMSPSPDGSPMAMIAPEKGGIAGGVGASPSGQASIAIYASCDDIDKHLKQIEGAGGRVATAKMELPHGMGFIAGFLDPSNNLVGLWQAGKPAPKKRAAAKKPAKKPAKKKSKR